jgi:hypothetical protein
MDAYNWALIRHDSADDTAYQAAIHAASVPGVDRVIINAGLTGTVHHAYTDITYDVQRDPDGQWNVLGQRDYRAPDLADALRDAIAADSPAGE